MIGDEGVDGRGGVGVDGERSDPYTRTPLSMCSLWTVGGRVTTGWVDGELGSDRVGWTGSAATRPPHKNTRV